MADIEEIGYSYVGEQEKKNENEIGYNIREEQTIDSYAMLGANNNTTTGEANTVYGVNEPKIIAETSIVWGGGGGTKIIEISDYQSISERQPVVNRVLNGEDVCVKALFRSFSSLQQYFFRPVMQMSNRIIFQSVRGTSDTRYAFNINCRMEGGDTTITSVTVAQYTK